MSAAAMTEKELRDRLAVAEADLDAAGREAGEAELDGGDVEAAAERVAAARDAVDRVGRALDVLEERARRERERERQRTEARMRLMALEWWLEYLRRAEVVIDLRPRLKAAEEELAKLGAVSRLIAQARQEGTGTDAELWLQREAREGRLDPEVVALPMTAVDLQLALDGSSTRRGNVGKLTVERARELLPRVEALVAEARAELDDRGEGA